MKRNYLLWFLAPLLGFLMSFALSTFTEKTNKSAIIDDPEVFVRPLEAVAALGQLSPLGEVRRLAAPVSGFGGTPRISKLLVREGQLVKKGEEKYST